MIWQLYFYSFEESPSCFPQWLHQFTFWWVNTSLTSKQYYSSLGKGVSLTLASFQPHWRPWPWVNALPGSCYKVQWPFICRWLAISLYLQPRPFLWALNINMQLPTWLLLWISQRLLRSSPAHKTKCRAWGPANLLLLQWEACFPSRSGESFLPPSSSSSCLPEPILTKSNQFLLYCQPACTLVPFLSPAIFQNYGSPYITPLQTVPQ